MTDVNERIVGPTMRFSIVPVTGATRSQLMHFPDCHALSYRLVPYDIVRS